MAKKKRNSRKKHNDVDHDNNSHDFLADLPEKDAEEWSGEKESFSHEGGENNMQNSDIVDPYSERLEEKSTSTETPMSHEDSTPQEDYIPSKEQGEQRASSFSLGAFLHSERERLGISLKNVSQSTKINLTNLEYLEADDLNSLPDRAYVIGYVKSYAKLLGINVNLCLNLLDKTYANAGSNHREPEIVIPQAQNSPQMANSFPVAKIASIAAMIIIIVGVVGFFLTRNSNKSVQVEEEVKEQEIIENKEITPQTLNAETPLQEDLPIQDDSEEIDTELSQVSEEVTPVAVATKAPVVEKKVEVKKEEVVEEVKEEVVAEKKEVVEVKKETAVEEKENRKFYPLTSDLYTFDTSMSSEKIDEFLPSDFKVSPVDGIQAVFITAVKSDSWLTYKSDDDPIKKFVLKKGRSLLFRAKEARVFLGNLGAVKIFLNNRPLIVTSRTGVKSLVFPQENANKYVMPLFIYKEDGSVQTSKEWIEENQ
ncbi:MAG: helix-turn-helix domain-containing protein [Bacteriovoracaceae bacterium]|nr:helix-turn-helix domain-containing protein [Bacteriovoracaceae bacterium]